MLNKDIHNWISLYRTSTFSYWKSIWHLFFQFTFLLKIWLFQNAYLCVHAAASHLEFQVPTLWWISLMNLLPFHRGNNLKFCIFNNSIKSPKELISNIESFRYGQQCIFLPSNEGCRLSSLGSVQLCTIRQFNTFLSQFWCFSE